MMHDSKVLSDIQNIIIWHSTFCANFWKFLSVSIVCPKNAGKVCCFQTFCATVIWEGSNQNVECHKVRTYLQHPLQYANGVPAIFTF